MGLCAVAGRKEVECPSHMTRCGDGVTCKPTAAFCNGRQDCPDGSDEGEFCREYINIRIYHLNFVEAFNFNI